MQFVQQLLQGAATVIAWIAIVGFVTLIIYDMPEHYKDTFSTRDPLLFAVAGVFIYLGCALAGNSLPEYVSFFNVLGLVGAMLALVAVVGLLILVYYHLSTLTKEVFGSNQPLLFAIVGIVVFFYGSWVYPQTSYELSNFFFFLSVIGAVGIAWYVTKVTIYIGNQLNVSTKTIVCMLLLPIVFYPIIIYTEKKS